jgi:hypothetical protein
MSTFLLLILAILAGKYVLSILLLLLAVFQFLNSIQTLDFKTP